MARKIFLEIYQRLHAHYGPQHWWPARTSLEMVVGAVLTQNTNWQNVSRALTALREADLLDFSSLLALPPAELAEYIRPAGYYNLKAKRLKNLLSMIATCYEGRLERLFEDELDQARRQLLAVNGIGEETADSILLYGAGQPIFVVDAYTHRVFSRHLLVEEEARYGDIQDCFMSNLPPDAELFNEYHALIVRVAKEYCKKRQPLCEACPLNGM